jgi:hypothetical protein
MGASYFLQEQKLSVPGDVAIIGFDDLPFSGFVNPPLTTVRQPIYEKDRLDPVDPDVRLGGQLPMQPDLARDAVGRLADDLGLDPMACAEGIVRVTDAQMVAVHHHAAGFDHLAQCAIHLLELVAGQPVQRRCGHGGMDGWREPATPGRRGEVVVDPFDAVAVVGSGQSEENRVRIDADDRGCGDAFMQARRERTGPATEVDHHGLGDVGQDCLHDVADDREAFLPPQDAMLRGTPVHLPRRPEAFLEGHYGPGWKVPDPGFVYHASDVDPRIRENLGKALITPPEYRELLAELEAERPDNPNMGRFVAVGAQDLYPLDRFIT